MTDETTLVHSVWVDTLAETRFELVRTYVTATRTTNSNPVAIRTSVMVNPRVFRISSFFQEN